MAVKGAAGRKETCINHPDRPAVARCMQCHTPVCKSCAVKTKQGVFCSTECRDNHGAFAEGYKGPAKLSKNYIHKITQAVVYVVALILILEVLRWMDFWKFPEITEKLFPWH